MEQTKYLSRDTIHALATPVGGALSIVRMSGPFAISILEKLAGNLDARAPRELFRTKLTHRDLLDEAMTVYYRAPKSQTGEDLVEFFLHGGAIVSERVLQALLEAGSRQALPGEFSFRAVRNGKMSITEARAVADLIASANEEAAKLALEKMGGTQSRLVTDLAERLRKLASMGELSIDFADQDIDELSLPVLKKEVSAILVKLVELGDSFRRGEKIQSGVRTAFIGRPNAGKSSFFNALLGEERSIVSEFAGTTRDVVREQITLRSGEATVTLRMEDTAGIRSETSDRIEREGIARSSRAAKSADFVILIADADADEKGWKETEDVYRTVSEAGVNKIFGVLTKIDCVSSSELENAKSALEKMGIALLGLTSSRTFEGISESGKKIAEYCAGLTRRNRGEVLLTRLDELQAVQLTTSHLERALSATEEDLFAADLRHALIALAPLIGETLPDDLLGLIFSEFCIGK